MAALLCQQIGKEFYSACLYLPMANYYHLQSLDGFGKWYDIQAREEMDHGYGIVKYLLDREQVVKMDGIAAPVRQKMALFQLRSASPGSSSRIALISIFSSKLSARRSSSRSGA